MAKEPYMMDKDKINQALRSIRRGNFVKTSVIEAGINYSTHLDWIKKGKKGIKPYAEYYERVEMAKAKGEMAHVDNIYDSAMAGNVGASQWALSRMYPERWGKKEKLDVKNDTKQEIRFVPYKEEK